MKKMSQTVGITTLVVVFIFVFIMGQKNKTIPEEVNGTELEFLSTQMIGVGEDVENEIINEIETHNKGEVLENTSENEISDKNKENSHNDNESELEQSGLHATNGAVQDSPDTNKDGTLSADEEMRYPTPEKQACIKAGYGVVVEMDGGEWYAVLTHGDGYVNGKSGSEILREYLAELDLEPVTVGGCFINMDKDWYWWTAEDIRELVSPEDDAYWDL